MRRPEKWHGQTLPGNTTVLGARPCHCARFGRAVVPVRRGLKGFRDFFVEHLFLFCSFFASRERFEGFIRVLDSCFRNEVVKIN